MNDLSAFQKRQKMILPKFPKIHFVQLIIVFLLLSGAAFSQGQVKVTKIAKEADQYFEKEEYASAYVLYDSIVKSGDKNPYFRFKKGACCVFINDRVKESITILDGVHKENPKDHIILYYLGMAYHHDYQFDKAIEMFDKYISYHDDDQLHIQLAERYRRYSVNGSKLLTQKNDAEIKNIGFPVNTPDDEYVPVISADESVLFYTHRGEKSTGGKQNERFRPDLKNGTYYEDVYFSKHLPDNSWGNPMSIGTNINTKHNDACIALSADGQELYTFYSDDKNGGDIYVCYLQGDNWSAPIALNPNINTEEWEGSCSVSADGKYLYFSSERPDGFGKKDIYVSTRDEKGEWGPAKNLGPMINSEEDEDDPFIHSDGLTLFFSSNGYKSMGGYDVMSSMKKDGKWLASTNMGMPLNTPNDDRFFVMTAKGDKGYFSSNRASVGGKNHQDIFTISQNFFKEKPALALIVGNIYGNEKPIQADIEIIRKKNKDKIGPFHSNSTTGKYLLALSFNDAFVISIKAEGYPEYKEEFQIPKLNKYLEVTKDFHLYKDGFADKRPISDKKLTDIFKEASDSVRLVLKLKDTAVLNNVATTKKITEEKIQNIASQKIEDAKPSVSTNTNEKVVVTNLNPNQAERSYSIYFDFNKSDVLSANSQLTELLASLQSSSNYSILITGHTDEKGSPEYNKQLSLKRANAVRSALLKANIKSSKITNVIGKGEENPLTPCPSLDCDDTVHAKNRRVEIKLLTNKN